MKDEGWMEEEDADSPLASLARGGPLFVVRLSPSAFILHPSSFILHPFFPDQARIGFRAAWTSSGRLMGKVWGASESRSGGSSVMRNRASEKASSVALVSVSVGSIIIASRR